MIASIKKALGVSPVAGVDEQLAEIGAQMQGCASEQASVQVSIDGLTEEMRAAIEAGTDTVEIEGRVVAARVGLERLAWRHSMLERVAREKAAALQEKRRRLRDEALAAALADDRAGLAAVDEEIIKTLIVASVLFGKRLKLEQDAFGTGARLQHLTGIPRGLGDLAWNEAPLVAEFLRRHPEATRPVSFGEQPWGPFTLTIPVLTPDRVTAALVADDASGEA